MADRRSLRSSQPISRTVDFVLVVVGVRPGTELAADASNGRTGGNGGKGGTGGGNLLLSGGGGAGADGGTAGLGGVGGSGA